MCEDFTFKSWHILSLACCKILRRKKKNTFNIKNTRKKPQLRQETCKAGTIMKINEPETGNLGNLPIFDE